MGKALLSKLKESVFSVLPIYGIVFLLHITNIAPLSAKTLKEFFISGIILIVGMALFNLGADSAMMPIGERISSKLIKKGKVILLLIVAFVLGVAITVAEPDLSVLSYLVQDAINPKLVVYTIAVGVGIFMLIAVLRVFLKMRLKHILLLMYALVFILANISDPNILPLAFDAGGVTTGPVTVPFMMALGIGIASIKNGRHGNDANFGMVSLCSVGPIMMMLLLGCFTNIGTISTSVKETTSYWALLGEYSLNVALALLPIVIIFLLLQIRQLEFTKQRLFKIFVGIIISYVGLVLFLSAVEYGFMSAGTEIGTILGAKATESFGGEMLLIGVGFALGFFAVLAEPAIHVLNKLVEETSGGVISRKTIFISLAIGVGFAVALCMVRITYQINFMVIIGIGYAIALILSTIVDDVYVGIAFDSGGVASGPMSSSFILPLAIGVASAMGRNILSGAFGVVATIALIPLITIQLLGLIVKLKHRHRQQYFVDDVEIIEL